VNRTAVTRLGLPVPAIARRQLVGRRLASESLFVCVYARSFGAACRSMPFRLSQPALSSDPSTHGASFSRRGAITIWDMSCPLPPSARSRVSRFGRGIPSAGPTHAYAEGPFSVFDYRHRRLRWRKNCTRWSGEEEDLILLGRCLRCLHKLHCRIAVPFGFTVPESSRLPAVGSGRNCGGLLPEPGGFSVSAANRGAVRAQRYRTAARSPQNPAD